MQQQYPVEVHPNNPEAFDLRTYPYGCLTRRGVRHLELVGVQLKRCFPAFLENLNSHPPHKLKVGTGFSQKCCLWLKVPHPCYFLTCMSNSPGVLNQFSAHTSKHAGLSVGPGCTHRHPHRGCNHHASCPFPSVGTSTVGLYGNGYTINRHEVL